MKYLGSKTIETERLILKAQPMKEQKDTLANLNVAQGKSLLSYYSQKICC